VPAVFGRLRNSKKLKKSAWWVFKPKLKLITLISYLLIRGPAFETPLPRNGRKALPKYPAEES